MFLTLLDSMYASVYNKLGRKLHDIYIVGFLNTLHNWKQHFSLSMRNDRKGGESGCLLCCCLASENQWIAVVKNKYKTYINYEICRRSEPTCGEVYAHYQGKCSWIFFSFFFLLSFWLNDGGKLFLVVKIYFPGLFVRSYRDV